MFKNILFLIVLCFVLFVISCDDVNKFSKKFENSRDFAEWLNSNGHKATLVKVHIFPMIPEAGDFIIDGTEYTCSVFKTEDKWKRYPELIEAVADPESGDGEPVFKSFYNIRCFSLKKK